MRSMFKSEKAVKNECQNGPCGADWCPRSPSRLDRVFVHTQGGDTRVPSSSHREGHPCSLQNCPILELGWRNMKAPGALCTVREERSSKRKKKWGKKKKWKNGSRSERQEPTTHTGLNRSIPSHRWRRNEGNTDCHRENTAGTPTD